MHVLYAKRTDIGSENVRKGRLAEEVEVDLEDEEAAEATVTQVIVAGVRGAVEVAEMAKVVEEVVEIGHPKEDTTDELACKN